MDLSELKIGFIGAGNMAYAIASGMISNGVTIPEHVWASAPTITNLQKLQVLGCNITHSNYEVVKNSDVVLICVKSVKAPEALDRLKLRKMNKIPLFISIISGFAIKRLEFLLPGHRIIRMMPNLPAIIQAGAFVYAMGSCLIGQDYLLVQNLFSKLGICEQVPENLLDAVYGLSGSGPAYVFTTIQAMSDGGVKMGIPRSLATKLAAQTVMGAAKMVLETGKHPDVLRDEVCSPGGTTIHGVHALENAGVRSAFIDAVEAATRRAKEMGSMSNETPTQISD